MPIDLSSKKAHARARKHAKESAKAAADYKRLYEEEARKLGQSQNGYLSMAAGDTSAWIDAKVQAAADILPPPENLHMFEEPSKTEQQLAKEQIERGMVGWPWRGDDKRATTLVRSNSHLRTQKTNMDRLHMF
jgi:hypothetical protein